MWTANPESGNVAVIDATTYAVRLARAGFRPTTVAGLPGAEGEDGAIVLNQGSSDATVLRIDADGAITRQALDTHTGANAVAVSPSGRFAVVWTDARKLDATKLDPTDSLQDVTVLALGDEPTATILSVGYRPSRVVFDAAEERALVVTEPGLSVIELGDDSRVSALVELTENPVDDPAARDVSITPDGAFALVRLDGSTKLGVVELATGARRGIELGDFVSDLDLSADGSEAFAVIGSAQSTVSTLVVIPVPVESTDASTYRRATVSSVVARSVSIAPDGSLALLYSNAEPNPYLAVLTSDDGFESYTPRALDLKAPVRAVFAAPVGPHGIAFQDTDPASTKRGAFSLISAEANRAPEDRRDRRGADGGRVLARRRERRHRDPRPRLAALRRVRRSARKPRGDADRIAEPAARDRHRAAREPGVRRSGASGRSHHLREHRRRQIQDADGLRARRPSRGMRNRT